MGYYPDKESCACDTPSGSENRRCEYCQERRKQKPIKFPNMEAFRNHHHQKRAGMSDYILLHYFKIIRHQCKWGNRQVDTLLEYLNELEYRGIKYRL